MLSALLTTTEVPFFFACGVSGTHVPLVPPQSFVERVDASALELPPDTALHGPPLARKDGFQSFALSPQQRREYTATYLAAASYVDAQVGHLVEMVDRLLASGADTDSRDENGETALHLAAHVGHAAVCTTLLDAGAPIEAASETGYTPLHMAAERGHAAIVRSLLSRGADVTATTTLGATPLHWAAYHDHPEAVAILLRHGASPAARDAEGETAATLAIARAQSGSHSDVLELLKGLARHDRERRQAELRQRERQPQEQQDGQQVEL
jgi:ankyrin repeat protein